MHFEVHGQWWSYPLIQTLHSRQCLILGFIYMLQILHILKYFSYPIISIYSVFPLWMGIPGSDNPKSKYNVYCIIAPTINIYKITEVPNCWYITKAVVIYKIRKDMKAEIKQQSKLNIDYNLDQLLIITFNFDK